ncbi:MAG TPA: hemolysin family protein [Pirellulaceae bacterium]|nr:hemolysin family protein [Pirellulaceae bacterium]HMO91390.1 hemolysin family protein [Pirellulaceae bacterium]HMP69615.1 hemolysin family protein [Pirellulaceae bacterium]
MISQAWLIGLTLGNTLVSTFAATAAQVLHEFARHELEEFCQKKGQPQVFVKIIQYREELVLGAEALRIICFSLAHICGLVWVFRATEVELLGPRFALITALIVLIALTSNSWLPKALARVTETPFLYFTWRFWWLVAKVTQPLTFVLAILSTLLYRAAGQAEEAEDEEEAFDDELRSIVSGGERDGLLDVDTREMIEGIIELDDTTVTEVMTPKKAIVALEVNTPWEEAVQFFADHSKTRIPIYDGELNSILGFVHSKDLLPEVIKPTDERKSIRQLIREAIFVPESLLVDELLQRFQQERRHLAIVQDEYGGVVGLITIEDILEEIVGDIVDEVEPKPEPIFERLDDQTVLIDGSVRIEKLNEELGWDLPEDLEVDTVGGLMMYELKEIPRHHQVIRLDDYELKAIGRHPRVVEQVRVKRIAE